MYKTVDRVSLSRFLRLQSRQRICPQPIRVRYSTGLDWISTDSHQLIDFLGRYTHYIPHTPLWNHATNSKAGLRELFALNNVQATFGSSTTATGNQSKNLANELLGFSHSSCYQCPFGVCVVINFFGDDVNVCTSHVVGHLRHYVDVVSDDVSIGCYLHFPRTIDAKTVEDRLREGLGQRVKNDSYDVTEAAHFTVRMRYAKL